MNLRYCVVSVVFVSAGLVLMLPVCAYAYGGPGSVISGIGALLAVVAALGAAVFGFFWFPVKRLLRKLRGGKSGGTASTGGSPL